ncbi:hypothetical protein NQ318_002096 [Aromia moschata]|uniref:Uncharacterized protein n=1 Tax=Aromia moschata TaxID=1265417 RepID=A0AAV8Y5X3_9CUCU|nr:hypothetical protein NQ318_002096 [Aromia moschata]
MLSSFPLLFGNHHLLRAIEIPYHVMIRVRKSRLTACKTGFNYPAVLQRIGVLPRRAGSRHMSRIGQSRRYTEARNTRPVMEEENQNGVIKKSSSNGTLNNTYIKSEYSDSYEACYSNGSTKGFARRRL